MSNTEQHKAVTTNAWKKAALHYPLCPSGVRVGIKVPDLPALIEAGEIPQHLLDAAIGAAQGQQRQVSKDDIVREREFTDKLVQITVVEPSLSDADLREVPFEDKEFIVQIATRQRDLDAEGEHIGGLTNSEKFRRFRGLNEFSSTVEGL